MFKINSCLHPVAEKAALIDHDHIVIFCRPEKDKVYLLNLDGNAKKPICVSFKDLQDQIMANYVEVVTLEWHPKTLLDDSVLEQSDIDKYRGRFSDIEPLISDMDSLLSGKYGESLVKNRAAEIGKSPRHVYNMLYLYWRQGQRPKGLLASKNSSQKVKDRNITVKQGRRAGSEEHPVVQGKLLDANDISKFKWAAKMYIGRSELTMEAAFKEMELAKYGLNKTRKCDGQYVIKLAPIDKRPTFDQFYYWYKNKSGYSAKKSIQKKMTHAEYEKDHRGLAGMDRPRSCYPGQEYQLDETPYDELLVSEFDGARSIVLKKATVYSSRETFCYGFSGLYITVDDPSFKTARLALFNTFRDKVGFCAEQGVEITKLAWPINGVGSSVFVDNAELANKLSESCVKDLGLTIQFGRAFRGDDKGLVERAFEHFKSILKGKSKAHMTKTMRSLHAKLAVKHACLTIRELYLILITYIIYFNEHHYLEDYPMTAEMKRDGVQPYANQIWQWGLKNRPGALRDVPEEEIYMKTLEVGEVSVHRKGVYLKGKQLWYDCEWTYIKGLQDRKESRNEAPVFSCRYARQFPDIIYLMTPEGMQPATLNFRHGAYSGLSMEEIRQVMELDSFERKMRQQEDDESLAGVNETVNQVLRRAAKEKAKVTPSDVSRQRIKDNRDNQVFLEDLREGQRMLRYVEQTLLSTNRDSEEYVSDQKSEPEIDGNKNRFFNGVKK